MKELELNKIHNIDCLEFMKTLPDKCIDLVLTDPPYGINVENNYGVGNRKDRAKTSVDWDKSTPSDNYFKEIKRVSKEQIIWGANYFNCFTSGGAIVWDKLQPLPDSSQCEIASYSRLKKVFKYTQRWTNFVNTKATNHPTEKPVELMAWCIKEFSKESDIIYDPFAGSGTTGVACKMLGRDYILNEISPEYCKIAQDRIKSISNPLF